MWCWHCCHPFDGEPLSLPYKYDELRNKFSLAGRFCSWGCMKTYNITRNGVNRGGIIVGNIVVMRKKMYGIVAPIKAAPDSHALQVFGGTMTIDEFRAFGTRDTSEIINKIDYVEPKQIVIKPNASSNDQSRLFKISDSKGTNEPLRLKRPKPLKRDENNLEKMLGITRKKIPTSNTSAITKS